MDSKSLMVGDWVMYDPNVFIEDEYEPYKSLYPVQILNGEDINLAINDCYAPIPLTTEILKLNGFNLLKCKAEIQSDNFIITFYGNHLDIIVTEETEQIRISKNIRYVHEFQHALRCCDLCDLANNLKIL